MVLKYELRGSSRSALGTEGRPDWYYAKRQAETERQFSVSISELELLGIQIPNTHYIPVRFTKYREFDSEQMKAGFIYLFVGNGYLLVKSVQANWTDFLSRDNMQRLVLAKCRKLLKSWTKSKTTSEDRSFCRQAGKNK